MAQNATAPHVRGTIVSVDGPDLTIADSDGLKIHVAVGPTTRIMAALKSSLVEVTPGTYVGIANTGPNGLQDALEIHIFPAAMRGTYEGQKPWDLGAHSRMTSGTAGSKVESYDGQDLTLMFKGGECTIQVRPNTPVVRLEAAAAPDVKAGATVFVDAGPRRPDGSFAAETIVFGKDGAKPFM